MSTYSGSDGTLMSQEISSTQVMESIRAIQERLARIDCQTKEANAVLDEIGERKQELLATHKQRLLDKEEKHVEMLKLKAEADALRSRKDLKRAMMSKERKEAVIHKGERVQVNQTRLKMLAERLRLRGLMTDCREKMKEIEANFSKRVTEVIIDVNRTSALKKREIVEAKKSVSTVQADPKYREYRGVGKIELEGRITSTKKEIEKLRSDADIFESMIRSKNPKRA